MHLTLLRPENRECGNFYWAIEGRGISWCCCDRSVTSDHICRRSKERAEQLFVLCRPQIYHLATISCFVFGILLVLFATRTIMFVFISLKYGLFLCNLPFLQPMVQHSESSAQSKWRRTEGNARGICERQTCSGKILVFYKRNLAKFVDHWTRISKSPFNFYFFCV